MPPSDATNQYPALFAVGLMPTTGRCSLMLPVDP